MALTYTASEALKYVKTNGTPNPIEPAKLQTWMKEIEVINQGLALGFGEPVRLITGLPTADGTNPPTIVYGEASAGNNGIYQDTGTWIRRVALPGVTGPEGPQGDPATVDASSIRTAIVGQPALLSPADDDLMAIVDTSAGNLKSVTPSIFWSNYLQAKVSADYVIRVNLLGNYRTDLMATTALSAPDPGDHLSIADANDGNDIKRLTVANMVDYTISQIASTDLGPVLYGTTNVTGLASNDAIPLNDESASFALRHTTIGSMATYFDSVFGWASSVSGATSNSSLADADLIGTLDASATYGIKKSTLGDLDAWAKAKNDTRYLQLAGFTTNFAALVDAAPAMTAFEDVDRLMAVDDSAGDLVRQITWGNFKTNVTAAMWTDLGPKIAAGTSKASPVGADTLALSDSAATDASKKLSLTNLDAWLKTNNDARYVSISGASAQFQTTFQGATTITDGANGDYLAVLDNSDSNSFRKLTFGTLWNWFWGRAASLSGNDSGGAADDDFLVALDTTDSSLPKRLSFAAIWTWIRNKPDIANTVTKLATIETSADVTDATNVRGAIIGTTANASLADGDIIPTFDASGSYAMHTSTLGDLWAWINAKGDLRYVQLSELSDEFETAFTNATTITDAANGDYIAILDNSNSNGLRKITFTSLWNWFWGRGATLPGNDSGGAADDDFFVIMDTSDFSLPKRLTFAAVWSWIRNKPDIADTITKVGGIEAGADVTDATNIGSAVNGATSNASLVDADLLPTLDASASYGLRKTTFGDVWTWIRGRFNSATVITDIGNLDRVMILDASDSDTFRGVTFLSIFDWIIGRFNSLSGPSPGVADEDFLVVLDTSDGSAPKRSTISALWLFLREKADVRFLKLADTQTQLQADVRAQTALASLTDADEVPVLDASAGRTLHNFTIGTLWNWWVSKINTQSGASGGVASEDFFMILDTSASNAPKRLSVSGLNTFYQIGNDARYRKLSTGIPNPRWVSLPGWEPSSFTSALTGGDPYALAAASGVAVDTNFGKGLRLTGIGIVAQRFYVPVAYGQVYMARTAVIRSTNGSDPAGDAIEFGIAWYDKNLTLLAGAPVTVAEEITPTVADGLQRLEASVNGSVGGNVAIIPPPGAIYAKAYVETYGATPTSDVLSISIDPVYQ